MGMSWNYIVVIVAQLLIVHFKMANFMLHEFYPKF